MENERNKFLEILKKRALGYEVEEIQTLVEETTSGTKKKIIRNKKHIPPDVSAAKYMYNKLSTNEEKFNELFEMQNRLNEVTKKWK